MKRKDPKLLSKDPLKPFPKFAGRPLATGSVLGVAHQSGALD